MKLLADLDECLKISKENAIKEGIDINKIDINSYIIEYAFIIGEEDAYEYIYESYTNKDDNVSKKDIKARKKALIDKLKEIRSVNLYNRELCIKISSLIKSIRDSEEVLTLSALIALEDFVEYLYSGNFSLLGLIPFAVSATFSVPELLDKYVAYRDTVDKNKK